MTASNNCRPLIITDLDGTLLDHHSYSFAAAKPALTIIAERRYPLIFNSSKTRAELLVLQQQLGIRQPFICENGAAVWLPESNRWRCQSFASPRSDWLPWVHQLRAADHLPFEGFSDWDTKHITDITGLSTERATLAAERDYSEPLLWLGSEDERIQFETKLAEQNLRLVQGGRFYSLQGHFNKAQAMQWLRREYQRHGPVVTIALGDNPNDFDMLNSADIAVIVQSSRSDAMKVEAPKYVLRTTLPGPEGWQQAMNEILSNINHYDISHTGVWHG